VEVSASLEECGEFELAISCKEIDLAGSNNHEDVAVGEDCQDHIVRQFREEDGSVQHFKNRYLRPVRGTESRLSLQSSRHVSCMYVPETVQITRRVVCYAT
jgi:hypothetical protein